MRFHSRLFTERTKLIYAAIHASGISMVSVHSAVVPLAKLHRSLVEKLHFRFTIPLFFFLFPHDFVSQGKRRAGVSRRFREQRTKSSLHNAFPIAFHRASAELLLARVLETCAWENERRRSWFGDFETENKEKKSKGRRFNIPCARPIRSSVFSTNGGSN